MFTDLFDRLLPLVGDFFGILRSIALTTPQWWLDSLDLVVEGVNDTISISYGNYFTGFGFAGLGTNLLQIPLGVFSNSVLGTILYNVIALFFGTFVLFNLEAPLFIALPISIAIWGVIIGVLKFLYELVLFGSSE